MVKPPTQLEGFFARLGPHREHKWEPLPWQGVANKVLFMDPVTGFTIELARTERGATFPEHYHTTMQTLFLAEGSVHIYKRDGRTIAAGRLDFVHELAGANFVAD